MQKKLNNSSTQHVTPQIYIKKASSSAYLAFMAIKMSFIDQPMAKKFKKWKGKHTSICGHILGWFRKKWKSKHGVIDTCTL
jgi:hypothetical protein